SGLTLDQGPQATPRFQALNAEGVGFTGAVNLMRTAQGFGTVQRLCVTSTVGAGGTQLYVNGQRQGRRERGAAGLRIDPVWVGGRYYTNGAPPFPRGFLDGDIAEVLVYDRVLTEPERAAVDAYLAAKHIAKRLITRTPKPTVGKPLIRVANAPPVQMFVPGF